MATNNKEVGVITEQGFVAGQGLGYTPTNLGNSEEKPATKPKEDTKKQSS